MAVPIPVELAVLRWGGGRIAFFDRHLVDALDVGISQIIVVGAGYDSRAWRFARPQVVFFELDHPSTQADKRTRAPIDGPVYVPVDLTAHTIEGALTAAGFDRSRPAMFIIEGVTMYLSGHDVRALLRELSDCAAPDSRLGVNFAAPPGSGTVVDRLRQGTLRLFGKAGGEAHQFFLHVSEAAAFVEATGWHVTETSTLRSEAERGLTGQAAAGVKRLHTDAGAVAALRTG